MSFDVVFGLMIAVIVVVLGGLLALGLYVFFLTRQENTLLQRDGATVEGEVVEWRWQGNAQTVKGRSGSSPVAGFLTYRFRAEAAGGVAQEFTHTDNVWVWTHWRYPVGARIQIRYLPSDPTTCRIG